MVDNSIASLIQRLERNPDDAEALEAVWRYYADREQHQQLATVVERVAFRRRNAATAAPLHCRVAEVWAAEPLRRIDRVLANYQRAVELDPAHLPATKALGEIYYSMEKLDLAAPLYERQAAATQEPTERALFLEDLLDIYERLEQPAGQLNTLRALVPLRPRDESSKKKLAKLLLARNNAGEGSDAERVEAARVLAALAATATGAARLALAEGALAQWPGEETTLPIVEEAYATAGRGQELVTRYIDFLTTNPGSPQVPRVRRGLATYYERHGQLDRAIETLEPLAGVDRQATATLSHYYEAAGQHAKLAALLAAAPAARTADAHLANLRHRVELHAASGDRPALLATYKEILQLDPGDAAATAELEREFRARGAFDELRALLRIVAGAPGATVDVRRARLRELAILSEQHLGDAAGAIDAWAALLTVEPASAEATTALERLLVRAERWDDLLTWLERRALAAPPEQSRDLWLRYIEIHQLRRSDPGTEARLLAQLWSQHPRDEQIALTLADARRRAGDVAGATEVFQYLAEQSTPETVVMRTSQLASQLEQAGQTDKALLTWQKVRALDPAHAMAWEAEERLLEAAGWRDMLLDTLVAHANHPVAAGKRAGALYAKAAYLAHALGDPSRAVGLAERAARLAPGDEQLAAFLRGLYAATGTAPPPALPPPIVPPVIVPAAPPIAAAPAAPEPAAPPPPEYSAQTPEVTTAPVASFELAAAPEDEIALLSAEAPDAARAYFANEPPSMTPNGYPVDHHAAYTETTQELPIATLGAAPQGISREHERETHRPPMPPDAPPPPAPVAPGRQYQRTEPSLPVVTMPPVPVAPPPAPAYHPADVPPAWQPTEPPVAPQAAPAPVAPPPAAPVPTWDEPSIIISDDLFTPEVVLENTFEEFDEEPAPTPPPPSWSSTPTEPPAPSSSIAVPPRLVDRPTAPYPMVDGLPSGPPLFEAVAVVPTPAPIAPPPLATYTPTPVLVPREVNAPAFVAAPVPAPTPAPTPVRARYQRVLATMFLQRTAGSR